MTDFDNTNRGAIWKNAKKEKETHPDFTGEINVEGVEYWVSGWKRKDNAPEKAPALSFSIKRKDEKPATAPSTKPQANVPKASGAFDDFSNDIPFARLGMGSDWRNL